MRAKQKNSYLEPKSTTHKQTSSDKSSHLLNQKAGKDPNMQAVRTDNPERGLG